MSESTVLMLWHQTRQRAQCNKCEYFDGDYEGTEGGPSSRYGDCHNPASGRFQTFAEDWCKGFYPDTTRWRTE